MKKKNSSGFIDITEAYTYGFLHTRFLWYYKNVLMWELYNFFILNEWSWEINPEMRDCIHGLTIIRTLK